MERLERMRDWLDARREYPFEVVRIFLGVALFVRGLHFVTHAGDVRALLEQGGVRLDFTASLALAHYVAIAHLCGGVLLAAGIVTRLAAAIQVPVLLGAVFFVHLRQGLFGAGQGLELAVLVLVLLLAAVFHGGGKLSVDEYLSRHARWGTAPAEPGV